MRTILTVSAMLAANLLLQPAQVQASHQAPLSRAACAYRDAIVHFAHEVVADHRLTQFERRLAPRLVNAAGRFYVAAQHPHHEHQLRSAWLDIESMHREVELVLFGHPGCPVYNALRPCWHEVLIAYNELTLLLTRHGCVLHDRAPVTHHPHRRYHHFSGVAVQWPVSQPIKQQSYRYRQTSPIISYRYGNVAGGTEQTLRSPSERQTSEAGQQAERAVTRRQFDRGAVGAVLSRRLD